MTSEGRTKNLVLSAAITLIVVAAIFLAIYLLASADVARFGRDYQIDRRDITFRGIGFKTSIVPETTSPCLYFECRTENYAGTYYFIWYFRPFRAMHFIRDSEWN